MEFFSRHNSEAAVLVLGATGQLGQALGSVLDNAVLLSRAEVDLSKPDSLPDIIASLCPSVIINAAAYTAVDKAESEEELAHVINAEAPRVLAGLAKAMEIPFIHLSTDYVFDGDGETSYTEHDIPAPLSAYGRTKRAGENAVLEVMGNEGEYLIFRTSWVYDATSANFFNTMLRLAEHRQELTVVADQIGAPTYAPHLAEAIVQALENATQSDPFPRGIYHLTGGGETSWHGFADAIIMGAKENGLQLACEMITPISTEDYPTSAERPKNSRLNCERASALLGTALPDWREGVAEALEIKGLTL